MLLLYDIHMWPQMINEMRWLFVIKAVVERLTSFQVELKGRILESILHGVEVDNILVKSSHTLYCPTYVIDDGLQNDGGTAPLK